MDVQLPDGTTVQGVPDGTTKAQLAQKLTANGRNVPDDWLTPSTAAPKQPTARSTEGQATPIAGIEDVGGEAYNVARGAIMGPLGNVAGLAAIPLHAAGAISTPPIDVQRKVTGAGAYTPQTGVGRAIEEWGPSALIGKAAEAAGGAVEKSPIFAGHPIAASLAGYGTKGAIEQAPMALGAKFGGKIAGKPAPEPHPSVAGEWQHQGSLNANALRDEPTWFSRPGQDFYGGSYGAPDGKAAKISLHQLGIKAPLDTSDIAAVNKVLDRWADLGGEARVISHLRKYPDEFGVSGSPRAGNKSFVRTLDTTDY